MAIGGQIGAARRACLDALLAVHALVAAALLTTVAMRVLGPHDSSQFLFAAGVATTAAGLGLAVWRPTRWALAVVIVAALLFAGAMVSVGGCSGARVEPCCGGSGMTIVEAC